MGRKKDKPRDRSYLEVRFQNLNNKKKLCPFAFQVAFFVFLFDCLISTCFLEKNTLGTRDSSSAVSGFCQVFIGLFSRGLGLRTPEYPATAEKKPLVPGVSEKSLYLSRYWQLKLFLFLTSLTLRNSSTTGNLLIAFALFLIVNQSDNLFPTKKKSANTSLVISK